MSWCSQFGTLVFFSSHVMLYPAQFKIQVYTTRPIMVLKIKDMISIGKFWVKSDYFVAPYVYFTLKDTYCNLYCCSL